MQELTSKILIFFFLCFFFPHSVFSNEKVYLEDITKTANVLQNSQNYEISLVENFLGFDYWQVFAKSSFLNRLKVIEKFPNVNSYQKESNLFQLPYSKKALMLHTFLENPTRNAFFIKPRSKIKLNLGLPVQVILWIHSNYYDVSMQLVLSQNKQADMIVELGDLKFRGWKRVKKLVRIPKRNYQSNLIRKNPIYFDKLYFHPKRSQKKGDFFIYISRIIFVIDKTRMNQTNIQIRDNW